MRMLRNSSVLTIAALVGLGVSCNWIDTTTYQNAIACLDKDNDGANFGSSCDVAGSVEDCNDDGTLRGSEEVPGTDERSDPSLWYDGLDNDCSFSGVGTEHDVLDFDDDGFPGISFDDWVSEGYEKLWPQNLPKDALSLDCNDEDDTINPQVVESRYDGIDSDCLNDDDFDADGDGYVPPDQYDLYQTYSDASWFTDLPSGDCDDSKANVNPGIVENESTWVEGNDSEWYDGIDQDCAGNNDFDQDGDGYIPEEYANQCSAFNLKYGYNVDCKLTYPNVDASGDCEDTDATRNPSRADIPYNGIDENCDNADDFDFDGDGFIPEEYVSQYNGFGSMPWHLDLEDGDCNDDDDTVKPGQLEYLDDSYDQDCDGNIDTTTFAYGGYKYEELRNPVLDANDNHLVLAVAADKMTNPDGDITPINVDDVGVGFVLLFPLDAGFEAEVSEDAFFQNVNGGPMTTTIDMIANEDRIFAAYSYRRQSKNWLLVRELILGTGDNYGQGGIVYANVGIDVDYTGIDLRMDPATPTEPGEYMFWAAACGEGMLHFTQSQIQPTSGVVDKLTPLADAAMCETTAGTPCTESGTDFGGKSCWIDFSGGDTYVNTFSDTRGNESYQLQPDPEQILAPSGALANVPEAISAVTHDDWFSWSQGSLGVEVSDGGTTYSHLTGTNTKSGRSYNVLYTDAVEHGGILYIASVVSDITTTDGTTVCDTSDPEWCGDGNNDVVLSYGTKTDTLTDVVFPYEGSATPQNPLYVTLHVDDNRVGMAVASDALTGTQDAVGWVFMGTP